MEANAFTPTTSKSKQHKTETKELKKRHALVSINENSRNSQEIRKEAGMKRSISIANLARRLSLNSLNKKTE